MNRTIGGHLSLDALHALSGRDRALRHFRLLTWEQQEQAIRRLAATGLTDYDICGCTALSLDQVRSALGPPGPADGTGGC